MHPEIRWSKPTACPLCGMRLTAVKPKTVTARRAHQHEGMQMDEGGAKPGHVAKPTDDQGMAMPGSDGMAMDHGSMGSMMGGCGMCTGMMGMGTSGMGRSAPPATQKTVPAPVGGMRGGRGCGC
jgi:hypothetical protein